MPRNKPYTKGSLVGDLFLLFITGGFWLFVVPFRELYRFNAPRKTC